MTKNFIRCDTKTCPDCKPNKYRKATVCQLAKEYAHACNNRTLNGKKMEGLK